MTILPGEWKALLQFTEHPSLHQIPHRQSHSLPHRQKIEDIPWPAALCSEWCHGNIPDSMTAQILGMETLTQMLMAHENTRSVDLRPSLRLFCFLQILTVDSNRLSVRSCLMMTPPWHGLEDLDSHCILWLCFEVDAVPQGTFLVLCKVVHQVPTLKRLAADLAFPFLVKRMKCWFSTVLRQWTQKL